MKPCCLDDLNGWLEEEAATISEDAFRRITIAVNASLDLFVKWPQRAELLWAGCDRRTKYHKYPDTLKSLTRQKGVTCNTLSNGPAITAYQMAGGQRPKRSGKHEWTIHHLYDGQFPYPGNTRGPVWGQSPNSERILPRIPTSSPKCRLIRKFPFPLNSIFFLPPFEQLPEMEQ